MKPRFSTTTAQCLRNGAIATILAIPLLLPGQPAEANFLQKLGDFLRGDTQEGADQGTARGAAIRDRRCAAENPNITGLEDAAAPAGEESQLIILAPNVPNPIKTVSATPEVFVYIPPDISEDEDPLRSLMKSEARASKYLANKQIDLEDVEFDDVISPDVRDEAARTEDTELVLELEFEGVVQQFSLPPEALIARIEIPEAIALQEDENAREFRLRLTCIHFTLGDLQTGTQAQESDAETEWVATKIQRVTAVNDVAAADTETNYEVYLENDVWLDMVAAMADDPTSSEWQALLEALDIPPVNPVPQPLEPFSPVAY